MIEIDSLETLNERPGAAGAGGVARAAWAVGLVMTSLLVTLVVSRNNAFLAYEMNGDTLLAPLFAQDVTRHAYALTGFQLARIPSLFPDLALQVLATAVTPDGRWAVFVYCAAQFLALTFVVGWLVRLVNGASLLWATTVGLLALAVVVLGDALLPGGTGIPLAWFQSCAHAGPFVLSLAATGLACGLLRRWRWVEAVPLGLATFGCVLSDRLVLVEFVLPTAAAAFATALLAWRRVPGRIWALLGLLALATALAAVADTGLYREADVTISFAGIPARMAAFATETGGYVRAHPGPIVLFAALPIAVFATLPVFARRLGDVRVEAVFLWLCGALALAAVAGSTAALVYLGPSSYRYLATVALWPLILLAALVRSTPRLRRTAAGVCGVGVAALLAGATQVKDVRPGPVAWRSDVEACLTASQARYGLRDGLAEYWVARPATFSSDGRIQVDQVGDDGRPRVYGSNPFWLAKRFAGRGEAPVYNFIVMQDLTPDRVRATYGAPSQSFQCSNGGPTVWVYADAASMTRTVMTPFKPAPGSYLRDCAPALKVGPDLFAQCPARDGSPRYSRIMTLSRCPDDIRNVDGRLTRNCTREHRFLSRLLHLKTAH